MLDFVLTQQAEKRFDANELHRFQAGVVAIHLEADSVIPMASTSVI